MRSAGAFLLMISVVLSGAANGQPNFIWVSEDIKFTHAMNFNLVMVRRADWSVDQVQKHVVGAAQVFASCGVGVESVRVQVIDPPGGAVDFRRDLTRTDLGSVRALAQPFRDLARPLIFFARSFELDEKETINNTAFSRANFQDSNQPNLPEEMVDTVWMPAHTNDANYSEECYGAQYSVLAHELAHLLTGDSSHNDDPERNLLSLCMGGKRNNHLTSGQCQSIRTSPLVRSLNNFYAQRLASGEKE